MYNTPHTCSGRTDIECKSCSKVNAKDACPEDNQYRTGQCTNDIDGFSCNDCSNIKCPAETYRTGSCGTDANPTENGFQCEPCLNVVCPAGKTRSGSCGGGDDPETKENNGYSCAECTNTVCPSPEQYVFMHCIVWTPCRWW